MIRDFFNKGREFADRLTTMVMNLTEVEIKVREATNDERWGPHGQLLRELAEYTFRHDTYMEVMCTLWRRMLGDDSDCWRRIYKSLIVLDYLLKNGSEQVINGAKEHIYDIRTLESFRFEDEIGKDQGINVRLKVKDIIDLLQDPDHLSSERAKSKSNRQIYTGFEGSNCGGSFRNTSQMSYDSRTGYFDSANSNRNPSVAVFPATAAARQSNTTNHTQSPPNRLTNFDDWNVGRERGLVDDVVEQIREAWDLTKMSTRDLFTRRQSDIYPHESNPRMVSEEMYAFPSEAAETDGTFEAEFGRSDDRNKHSTNYDPHFNGFRWVQQQQLPKPTVSVNSSNKIEVFEKPAFKTNRPRPPSVDLLTSAEPTNSTAPPTEPVDLLSWDSEADGIKTDVIPISSAPLSNHLIATDLFDSEFGDFVSIENPVNQNPVPTNFHSFDLAGLQPVASSASVGNADPWTSLNPSTVSNQPSMFGDRSSADISSTSTQKTSLERPSKPRLGETWKELDSLQINLDSLVGPAKPNNRAAAGPSLRELQNTDRTQMSVPKLSNQGYSQPNTVGPQKLDNTTGNSGFANFNLI